MSARTIRIGARSEDLSCNNFVSTRKYSWFSFLPVSLLFQFRSLSNSYFLMTATIMLIPGVSPISPYSAITPLCFVLFVSEVREFIEEYQKYRRDLQTNEEAITRLVKSGDRVEYEKTNWGSLCPGDLVVLQDRDKVPADIVLMASGSGNCSYVETSNLDGETNLKSKEAPNTNNAAPYSGEKMEDNDFRNLFGQKLTFESPNPDMYRFRGSLGDENSNLTIANMMLRGCSMRNTPWAVGVCVYTGHETKALLNSMSAGVTPSKKTTVEQRMNMMVLIVFVCQVLLIMGATFGYAAVNPTVSSYWYLWDLSSYSAGFTALTFFVLLNTIIPVSLWVSLEILKFLQAALLEQDSAMKDLERNLGCVAHSKNLNEELGQVTHVFSDKTGTLTCNRMQFKGCSIEGKTYSCDQVFFQHSQPQNHPLPPLLPTAKRRDLGFAGAIPIADDLLELITSSLFTQNGNDKMFDFFKCIALCHSCERVLKRSKSETENPPRLLVEANRGISTVYPPNETRRRTSSTDSLDEKLSQYTYQSSSPDEAALVCSAADVGFIFHKRIPGAIQVDIMGSAVVYDILHQVAFSTERRMMSVVVKERDKDVVIVFTKGADSSVIPRCVDNSIGQMLCEKTQEAVEGFSEKGLRTLCLAKREMPLDEWEGNFGRRIKIASESIDSKESKIAKIDDEIESNLQLLGCTAVEDKLQSGVHETIAALRAAGISVTMITGDKRETAINIARSCGLVNSEHNVYTMSTQDNMYGGGNFIHLDSLAELVGDGKADPLWGMTTEGADAASISSPRESVSPRQRSPASSTVHAHANKMNNKFCIVLDGAALSILLANPSQTRKLLAVMAHPQCEAAVFCRVNPKQKGLIVKSCRDRLTGAGCVLAIGDGANDISMIKEAHVGVGIFGEEGWQAAGSADYAIGKFQDLYRLLFVHGRLNYLRITMFICFFMYKNFAFTFLQFWMATLSAWSGVSILDSYCLLAFNSVFMVGPLFAAGLFDKDVALSLEINSLFPKLYAPGQKNELFKSQRVFVWLFMGLVHSLYIFFGVMLSWAASASPAIQSNGFNASFSMDSQAIYTSLLLSLSGLHNVFVKEWNVFYLFCTLIFHIVIYIAFVLVYNQLYIQPYGYIAQATFPNWNFWFTFGIIVFACALPMSLFLAAKRLIKPDLAYMFSSRQRFAPHAKPKAPRSGNEGQSN